MVPFTIRGDIFVIASCNGKRSQMKVKGHKEGQRIQVKVTKVRSKCTTEVKVTRQFVK